MLFRSIGAIVAACAILLTGWQVADPLISVFIAALILASSWKILRDSVNILLEAAPAGIDAEAVGQRMARQAGVAQVHDLHIWTITSGFPALSAHVLLEPTQDLRRRRLELERLLAQEYGIKHTTLQIDHADAGLQAIYLHSLEPGRICPQAHPETLSRKGHQ